MRLRPLIPAMLLLVGAVAVAVTRNELGDYELRPADDNAAPAIEALLHGDLSRAVDVMPAMGLVSILWRLPLAALGGADLLWTHRLGSLMCLLAVVAVGWSVDRRASAAGRGPLYRLILGGLLIAGPGVVFSLDAGHAEEILAGALATGAVLAATDGRRLTAAVLLGLALGTKQWTILAVVPVLLPLGGPPVLDGRRLQAAALAALIAALFVVPPILAAPSRYREISSNLAETARVYPQSLWWPVSSSTTKTISLGAGEQSSITTSTLALGLNRGLATVLALLAAAAVVPLALRRGGLTDPLATLTWLLALRCAIDPMNLDYYLAPALMAAAAWEATRGPPATVPLVSAALAAATVIAWHSGIDLSRPAAWAIWLIATAPFFALRRLAPSSGSSTRPPVPHEHTPADDSAATRP